MSAARYSAYITTAAGDPVSEIYRDRPNGNLIGELPLGAYPKAPGQCGTLDRKDGGDPFERALFILPSGRHIEIRRTVDPLDTAAAGRRGGKAGRGEAKRRGDSAYYRSIGAKRVRQPKSQDEQDHEEPDAQ